MIVLRRRQQRHGSLSPVRSGNSTTQDQAVGLKYRTPDFLWWRDAALLQQRSKRLAGRLATVPANKKAIARPLKVLIPLIQSELQMGNNAGHEHYRRAGEMLLEAQSQVARGGWGTWLKKNFDLSRATAYAYMGWARVHNEASSGTRQLPGSHAQMRGETERRREDRQSKQQQDFRRTLREVAREESVQERQTRAARQGSLPTKRYGVIYADPPWRFELGTQHRGGAAGVPDPAAGGTQGRAAARRDGEGEKPA